MDDKGQSSQQANSGDVSLIEKRPTAQKFQGEVFLEPLTTEVAED